MWIYNWILVRMCLVPLWRCREWKGDTGIDGAARDERVREGSFALPSDHQKAKKAKEGSFGAPDCPSAKASKLCSLEWKMRTHTRNLHEQTTELPIVGIKNALHLQQEDGELVTVVAKYAEVGWLVIFNHPSCRRKSCVSATALVTVGEARQSTSASPLWALLGEEGHQFIKFIKFSYFGGGGLTIHPELAILGKESNQWT